MYLRSTQGYGALIPGSEYIRSLVRQGSISKEAARRLRWMDYYAEYGNARLTCRYFGISAPTFYRWKNRYDPYDLTTYNLSAHLLKRFSLMGNLSQDSHPSGGVSHHHVTYPSRPGRPSLFKNKPG